jgi:hypothetical protein
MILNFYKILYSYTYLKIAYFLILEQHTLQDWQLIEAFIVHWYLNFKFFIDKIYYYY